MRKYLIAPLSAILLFACALTEPKTENSEENTLLKSSSDASSIGIKFTSALNILKASKNEAIDSVNFNGMWIIIENQKDIAQSLDLDIHIQDEDENIKFKNERLLVYVPSGSKTLFLPELTDSKYCNFDKSTFVIDGNIPIDSVKKSEIQLDIKIKNLMVTDQVITMK